MSPDPITHATCPFEMTPQPDVCSTEGGIHYEIQNLVSLGIHPDTFDQASNGARFDSIAVCGEAPLSLFSNFQTRLATQVSGMSTESIITRLTQLYERAYSYDEATRTMDVTNQQAKDELDMWIAVIEHQAYNDDDFLARVDIPDVQRIIGLNSPNLQAHHRAYFYRIENNLSTQAEESEDLTRQYVAWLQSYNGETSYLEDPFVRSMMETTFISFATFGREETYAIAIRNHPTETVDRLVAEAGWADEFNELNTRTDDVLITRIQSLFGLMGIEQNPQVRQTLARKTFLIDLILQRRGLHIEKTLRDNIYDNYVRVLHYTPEDAHLMTNNDYVQGTVSRLDDYRLRSLFLRQFRGLYTDFLSAPEEERFSPERSHRYNVWGQFILNSSMTGVPLRLADIDRVRREVQEDQRLTTDGAHTWDQLLNRDLNDPLWLHPDDLGGPNCVDGDVFNITDELSIGNLSLREYVRQNVDHIAILPPELVPHEHLIGVAYSLFGAIIMTSYDVDQPWNPGNFYEVLAHEAAHNHYARANFDDFPERLSRLIVNERFAYLTGGNVSEEYLSAYMTGPEESNRIITRITGAYLKVHAANRYLGLDSNNIEPLFDHSAFTGMNEAQFMIQPGRLIRPDGTLFIPREVYDQLSSDHRTVLWENALSRRFGMASFTDSERAQTREIIDSLDHLAEGDVSATFVPGELLLRFMSGGIQRELMPQTFTQESWQEWRRNTIANESLSVGYDVQILQNWEGLSERWPTLIEAACNAQSLKIEAREQIHATELRLASLGAYERTIIEVSDPLHPIISQYFPSTDEAQPIQIRGRIHWRQIQSAVIARQSTPPTSD